MTEQQAIWNKAHRKLKREVRRAHKKVSKQTDRMERALIDSGLSEEEALWALEEAERIERRVFRKKRKKLRKLARKESIAFDHYTEAEAEQAESFAVYVLED
jgi:hypothetical protein